MNLGITVPVPKGTLFCVPPEDQHDHGPIFLPGSSDPSACDDIEHNRYVLIFVSYNAIEETKKLGGFLKEQCTGIGGGPCRPAPDGLRVAGNGTKAAGGKQPQWWGDIL